MSDLNNYNFTGRLGNDAEVAYTPSGTAVWSARVAVGYGYGDHQGTNWLTVKCFGKRAEGLGKLDLAKGAQIGGCGELRVREYDKRDGTKGTEVEIHVRDVALLGKKPEGGAARGSSTPRQERPAAASGDDINSDFADDDLPF